MPSPQPSQTQRNHIDIVSLRDYFESRLESLNIATKLYNENMNHRLENLNAAHQYIKDQSTTFLTLHEHNIWKSKIDDEIRDLRETRSELRGKASATQANIAILFSLLAAILSVIGLIKGF